MTEITARSARMLSMLGQRGSIFGIALPEIAGENENVFVMTADLGILSGLTKFQKSFPDKYINMGIAEQNMLNVAAGLAKEGNCVFVTTYATFVTMRSFEQVRNNLGYMKYNVKIVGSSAGVAMGMSGNTHYAIEDISLMRSIPNVTVISPADAGEALKTAYAVAKIKTPVYIRLTGNLNCPVIYKEEYDFEIGKAITLRKGNDIAFIACGTMVNECLKAAELLANKGIEAEVINMHTIKPIDTATLSNIFKKVKVIVSVEEHSIIGGLGSAIAEYKAQLRNVPPQLFIGLPDAFGRADEQSYLLNQYGLTAEKIAERSIDFYLNNK